REPRPRPGLRGHPVRLQGLPCRRRARAVRPPQGHELRLRRGAPAARPRRRLSGGPPARAPRAQRGLIGEPAPARTRNVVGRRPSGLVALPAYPLTTTPRTSRRIGVSDAVTPLALLAVWALLFSYFRPSLLLLDTMTAGGDTPSFHHPIE